MALQIFQFMMNRQMTRVLDKLDDGKANGSATVLRHLVELVRSSHTMLRKTINDIRLWMYYEKTRVETNVGFHPCFLVFSLIFLKLSLLAVV
ncbi:hypothetical protein [Cellulosilyticum sp. I15G10I2]|uniref:hypothetical protein n=1 Tax=Cellulosilyticum sp. I15G10I2 TaxID=1892843 RepID=UPI001FA6E8E9|nr:hypothetical protein [Cellulosilyticum sp. I15G10I2]